LKKKNFIILLIIVLSLALAAGATAYHFKKSIIYKIAEKTFLKEKQPIKLGEYTLVIDTISGNELSGVKISDNNMKLEAKRGRYVYMEKENYLKIELNDGVVEGASNDELMASARMTFKQYSIKLSLDELFLK